MKRYEMYQGKKRLVRCNCTHDWNKDQKTTLGSDFYSLDFFNNGGDYDKKCPTCHKFPWFIYKTPNYEKGDE
jgi:cytochrome c2